MPRVGQGQPRRQHTDYYHYYYYHYYYYVDGYGCEDRSRDRQEDCPPSRPPRVTREQHSRRREAILSLACRAIAWASRVQPRRQPLCNRRKRLILNKNKNKNKNNN
jgi:hypothetical protein